jgi:hypothetical protein
LGLDLVRLTTNKVKVIKKKRMKMAQDKQKSYSDNKKRPLEFKLGD